MRKQYLHFWKCSGLFLSAAILLITAGWLSAGKAHAFFTTPEEIVEEVLPFSFYEQTTERIPYQTIRVASPNIPLGEEQIAQGGSEGLRTCDYEIVFMDGEEIDRLLLTETVEEPIDEIIEYGTAVSTVDADDRIASVASNDDGSGVLTFASGGTMKFSAVKGVTATAYTAGRGGAGYITASGTPARPGAVAVDRRVIPLGSKLYIVTDDGQYIYGMAVAEDTGVIGNRVDLYYDDYDHCIQFGRRAATIYILED